MAIEEHVKQMDALAEKAVGAARGAASSEAIAELRTEFLGRKSELSRAGAAMRDLSDEDRRTLGQAVNRTREAISQALDARSVELEEAESEARIAGERIDVTLPGRKLPRGSLHPLTRVLDDVIDAFVGIGFSVVEGPVVETDYYNFQALNIPPDHPARSMHDTLYVQSPSADPVLVRTHTSPMQARTMESRKPPLYVVIPGRCARRDEVDANHLAGFYQLEGLAVDEGLTFADMKGTLQVFAKALFGEHQQVRMHPSYFPFTEPSAELYVSCFACDGSGCPTCRGEGWIEIMGAGMVHPNVLKLAGYDSERYTGFAFGMGIERIAKLRYGVHDLRTFYENDLRFLGSF